MSIKQKQAREEMSDDAESHFIGSNHNDGDSRALQTPRRLRGIAQNLDQLRLRQSLGSMENGG